jgi:hypothetical protein
MLLSNVSFSCIFTAVCFLKRQTSRWSSPEAMVTCRFKRSRDFFTYGNFSMMDVVERILFHCSALVLCRMHREKNGLSNNLGLI